MRILAMLLLAVPLAGCLSAAARAEYDMKRQMTRIDFVLPEPKDSIFDRAMTLLLDEGFTLRTAERSGGLLATEAKHSDWSWTLLPFQTSFRGALAVTIHTVARRDSTRVVIAGRRHAESSDGDRGIAYEVTGVDGEWAVLEHLAARLRGDSPGSTTESGR